MPNISGQVYYATARDNAISGLSGINNVPVVIQDIASGFGIVVLTNSSGSYTVNNVPAGSYRIVEAWGATGGVPTPADFSTVTAAISVPTPKDPPLSAITSPLGGTNQVDSLSPNTLLVTVTTGNLTGRNFTDSSISNTPLSLPSGITLGPSLITLAGYGIWGTLPNGTPANTVPPTYPYLSSMSGGLTYVPNGGSGGANDFTMTNIGVLIWFFAPNHTTFDETSSYIRVNGGNPNIVLFKETLSVEPNSYYLASSWLIMVTNYPNTCLIGFRALAQDGTTQLFYGQTSNIQFGKWGQIGQIFNTKNNSQITLQVLSMSTAAGGNDFALDDVSLQLVDFGLNTTLTKSVDKAIASKGDTLVYTSVVNTNSSIFSLVFQDTIPEGGTFVSGSVKINGTTFGSYNPQTGFTLPNLASNGISTVVFNITVTTIPGDKIIKNKSNLSYSSAPIPGNTITNVIFSDTVPTLLESATLSTLKSVSLNYATVGDTLSYTITIENSGTITANDVVFFDTIPSYTTFLDDSVFINNQQQIGASPSPTTGGISLNTIASNEIVTLLFKVLVTSIPPNNNVKNTGNTGYTFTPQGSSVVTINNISNTVNTTVNYAILTSSKIVNKDYSNIGEILTYTIAFSNIGNTTANNIIFVDTIPSDTTLVPNSFNQDGVSISGSPNPPGVTLPKDISANQVSTISFKVIVNTIPAPNPIVNIASATTSFVIDPTTTPNILGSSISNTNEVYTQVNSANLYGIVKLVDRNYSTCGDSLKYTIVIPNTGNATAFNVLIIDTIPNGTVFIDDSVKINNVTQIGANPISGISIPTISPISTTTIEFNVLVSC